MSTMDKYTPQQRRAIEERGRNILVSAAAGSGKTSVLVERIMGLLTGEQPVEADRLLVLTFANAAAEEMRSRLNKRLTDALRTDPTNDNLRTQHALLTKANISTIHRFAIFILRQYFHAAGIDPHFGIADTNEMEALKAQVAADLVNEWHGKGNEVFTRLMDSYDGTRASSNNVEALIVRAHSFAMNIPFYEQWLDEAAAAFRLPPEQQAWQGQIQRLVERKLEAVYLYLERALDLASGLSGPHHYVPLLEEELEAVSRVRSSFCLSGLASISFRKLPSKGKPDGMEEGVKDAVQSIRNAAKGQLADLIKLVATPREEVVAQLAHTAPLMECFSKLVLEFSNNFYTEKQRRNVLDFNDLEHLCLRVLVDRETGRPTRHALELSSWFVHTMIDEYQDQSPVQECILQAVSRAANRFMVGDVKQSIYRFRSAEPSIFLEKYEKYPSERLPGSNDLRISLSQNFRSRAGILSATNFVFSQIMSRASCGISYDADARLLPGPESGGDAACFEVLLGINALPEEDEAAPSVPGQYDTAKLTSAELEAEIISDRILELVSPQAGQSSVAGPTKKVGFGDIVILMRNRKVPGAFMDVFRRKGIPLSVMRGGDGPGLELLEVSLLISLLQIVDNPRQEIPLAAVLCGPMVDISADELVELRTHAPGQDLYTAVLGYAAGQGHPPLRHKLKAFLDLLEELREAAVSADVSTLLAMLIERTGYTTIASVMVDGEHSSARIRGFLSLTRDFDTRRGGGLYAFLQYIERIREAAPKSGPAETSQGQEAVRIMTIHKSKGLEFPIVFLSRLSTKFNQEDEKTDILMHRKLGLGPRLVDTRRTRRDTLARSAIREAIKDEAIAEEMRTLYVGMTRAQDMLVLTGALGDSKELQKHSSALMHAPMALEAERVLGVSNMLEWIQMTFARHRQGEVLLDDYAGAPANSQLWDWDVPLSLKVVTPQDILATRPRAKLVDAEAHERLHASVYSLHPHEASKQALDEAFSWEYPHAAGISLPSKLSISEIKRIYQQYDGTQYYPKLPPRRRQPSSSLGQTELGIAVHTVMQHLDLSIQDETHAHKLVSGLVERGILQQEEAAHVPIGWVMNFLHSPLAARMRAARDVRREVPFVLSLPPSEIYPELALDSNLRPILVHGIIDCCFIEDGAAVVVDYKTDYPSEDLLNRYNIQLKTYKKAIERATSVPVKEAILFLVRSGAELRA